MNKKLIAAAVASTVAAPVTAMADGHEGVTVYGRINNAIKITDDNTDVAGVSSRFGIKYNKDLGNGMGVHGRYEFFTVTDREEASAGRGGVADIRIATVGLSGGFGRVDVGNQWSAYFDTFGTLVSPTYSLGYFIYSSIGGGPFRASNTIKYSNSFGPVYAELDVRLNDSNEQSDVSEKINGNGVGLGLSFAVTDAITIAAAVDSEDNDGVDGAADTTTDRTGIGIKGSFGSFWASLGFQNIDTEGDEVDTTMFYFGGKLGGSTNWLIGHSTADDDADSEATVWGIYHNLGGGLKLYYEATAVDTANTDDTIHFLGMRVDF
ncbi:MAG: porin [Pseudomonadota bacterium]